MESPARLNHPPALVRGQGLDPHQQESGNAAILLLLTSPSGEAWTDFVATTRVAADGGTRYEAWARRGMVAWVREPDGHGGLDYRVVEVVGVAGAYLASFEEPGDGRGRGDLAGMRPEPMDVGSERPVTAERRFDGHGTGDVCGAHQGSSRVEGEGTHGRHALGAVEERDPFLGL